MYATVADIRAEGVSVDSASDDRVTESIQNAMASIERATGWFFEPRHAIFALSGRGNATLEVPVPPIRLANIVIDSNLYSPKDFSFAPPAASGFHVPMVMYRAGTFPKGRENVWLDGHWGYTIATKDAPDGDTPRDIRRATVLLALQYLPQLADPYSVRAPWRLVEERTRDQSYRMESVGDGPLTGNPEVDAILLAYRKPISIGAA